MYPPKIPQNTLHRKDDLFDSCDVPMKDSLGRKDSFLQVVLYVLSDWTVTYSHEIGVIWSSVHNRSCLL